MQLQTLPQAFSVCQIETPSQADFSADFCFLCKTDEELSLVCPTNAAPAQALAREDGWRAFRIVGVLDFSLIGILSRITTRLSEAHIGVFAVSTYNTDYVLVKAVQLPSALEALRADGYEIIA